MVKTPQGATVSRICFCSHCNKIKEWYLTQLHTERKHRYTMEVSIHIQINEQIYVDTSEKIYRCIEKMNFHVCHQTNLFRFF